VTAAKEDRASKDEKLVPIEPSPPASVTKSSATAAVAATSATESRTPTREAFYRVRKNDSLSDIASVRKSMETR
jgi:Tfp pilus assembly protein FimV